MRAQTVILKADSVTVPCHATDTFLIPLRVYQFNNVAGLQFSLSWNPAYLDYAYISQINSNFSGIGFDTLSFINQGKFTLSWTNSSGLTLPDTTVLLTVAFSRIGGPATLIEFANTPTEIVAITPLGDDLVVQTVPGLVNPVDVVPPTISCPGNVSLMVNSPTAVNAIEPASLLDNCAVQSVGWVTTGATVGSFPADPDASGAVFNIGQSNVTYTVTDVGGNTATCAFTIDLELMPGDSLTLIASNETVSCGQMVTIDITSLNFDSIAGLQFSLGWDPAMLSFASVDNFNPALQLTNSNFGTTQTGTGFLGFAWTTGNLPHGTTIGNGEVLFSLTFTVLAGNNSSTNIQFGDVPTARTAFSGKTIPAEEIGFLTVNGAVSIADMEAPAIQCPANASVMAPTGSITAPVSGLEPLSLTDNCSGNIALSYAQSGATTGQGQGPANGIYNAGSTTVVYTAMDGAGNTATCSFTVIVDAGTPLTLLLDSVTTDCQATGAEVCVDLTVRDFTNIIGLQFNVVWDTAVLSFVSVGNEYPGLGLTPTMFFGYNSAPNGTLQFFGGNAGGWPQIPDDSTFFTICFTVKNPNATSQIGFSGTIDAVNNSFNSVPVVTSNGYFQSSDDTPPNVLCPANVTANAVASECNANVSFDPPNAFDVCSGIDTIQSDHPSDVYPAGVTTVVFTVLDNSGNSATCSITVTVIDDTPPEFFGCPADITVLAAQGCTATASWSEPLVTDACTPSPSPTLVTSTLPGAVFPTGDSLVTYMATDVFGNSSECSFTVTVADTAKPIIICPGDVLATPDSIPCAAIVDFSLPIASDNCNVNVAIDGDAMPKDTFDAGVTVVTYLATDNAGNTASCSFSITVIDQAAPVLDTCPADITMASLQNSCGANVSWTAPGATDDCSPNVAVSSSNPSGSLFPIGPTVVVYTATDGSNNSSTCSFTVTVSESVAPVISNCPLGFVFDMPPTQCDTVVTWTVPTATDNCGLDTLISSDLPGTVFSIGIHTVTYTAIDDSGNSSTCAFLVAVNDNVKPVFTTCPKDTVFNNATPCGIVWDWAFPTATDNCGLDTIVSTKQPSDPFFAGITEVLILASDNSGNFDTCAFTVTVNAIAFQAFTNFPNDTTIIGCPQAVTWTPPGVTGFCVPPTITIVPDTLSPGDIFPLGATDVIYVAIDSNGLQIRDTFTVTIMDNAAPLISCPESGVDLYAGGLILSDPDEFVSEVDTISSCDGVRVFFSLPVANDNCNDPLVAQTAGQFSGLVFAADSVHTLTFIATDAAGNTAECVVTINVQGLQPLDPVVDPPVACPGEEVVLMVDAFPGATYTWTGPNQAYPNNSQITVIASPANAGLYTVFAEINGCRTPIDSNLVVLATNPQANDDVDYMIDPGGVDTINVLTNDVFAPVTDFTVTFDSLPAGYTYLGNGVFVFQAGETAGPVTFVYEVCSNSCPDFCDNAVVTVLVKNNDCSFIPNIITPNSDGVNDYLMIPCLDSGAFRDNSLVIYNQWGDKVFEAEPYDNSPATAWKGTLNGEDGKDLPDGVYFYVFKSGPNEPPQKGFVQIYR
ncbi:MAG: HYR domain-containing protein [Saprospiraceae bacterium]|nr:HYR domain-containing protein [Saprospiraceae bacterium]